MWLIMRAIKFVIYCAKVEESSLLFVLFWNQTTLQTKSWSLVSDQKIFGIQFNLFWEYIMEISYGVLQSVKFIHFIDQQKTRSHMEF